MKKNPNEKENNNNKKKNNTNPELKMRHFEKLPSSTQKIINDRLFVIHTL